MNRRTAEQGTAEYRSEEYCLIPQKKLLLFEIPYSIFDIQNEKHAKAIRLKGEGFKPGEWKSKESRPKGPGFAFAPWKGAS